MSHFRNRVPAVNGLDVPPWERSGLPGFDQEGRKDRPGEEMVDREASKHRGPGVRIAGQWWGVPGMDRHVTRDEFGSVPVEVVRHMPGMSGEIPGHHRNRLGPQWDEFLGDIAENGIRDRIFINVFKDMTPMINEGNHRRDAAVELGIPEVPVQIRYFGRAEDQGSVLERYERESRR